MQIDEAIKRMKARIEGEFYDSDPENLDDMKLGIEALKREKEHRRYETYGIRLLLPGETEE